MQYVGRAFDSVTKTWNSINPSTLSGAIDLIVVEQEDGTLACSPFHVRFGKFSLLLPSDKKVEFSVNGQLTDFNMKLGDGGEAFFVFATENAVPRELQTSPIASPTASPTVSPKQTPLISIHEPQDLQLEGPAHSEYPHSSNLFLGESTRPFPAARDFYRRSNSDASEQLPFHNYVHRRHSSMGDVGKAETDSYSRLEGTALVDLKLLQKAKELGKRLSGKELPTHIDDNGDVMLDMTGYKASATNINIAELARETFKDEFPLIEKLFREDEEGNLWFHASEDAKKFAEVYGQSPPGSPLKTPSSPKSDSALMNDEKGDLRPSSSLSLSPLPSNLSYHYAKTLRLTSDQLRSLNLKAGKNDLSFSVNGGKATCTANLFFWRYSDPVVISDIDGTITKSDALGHMFTLIGKDWTHAGVAKLYTDITNNGYKIMYLTSRSVGQADSTRHYLRNIEQNGVSLPEGPVILSPDRTMAALHREVILRKPEVFKMACLRDLCNLFALPAPRTPFYAGFGNRITDAISYNHVRVPPTRIFTINSSGEVHIELLQRSGYRSTYVYMNDLVDYFFPPVEISTKEDLSNFTDVNFWRSQLPELSDEEDEPKKKSPKSPKIADSVDRFAPDNDNDSEQNIDIYNDEGNDEERGDILSPLMQTLHNINLDDDIDWEHQFLDETEEKYDDNYMRAF
ncbi:lipin Ned1 [Schizosaccharomyces cryophilus OY26]|uniref:Lipin Ned1 n=1 Tax=Schizosaccharomyces cryophilus (strain OY26 / ATCC MYA-4695 / CBS 11777 / NBRC 106824 / NRRL Y48691) TaxID=653667 RepID=S9XG15_SCHCR|nr:lipin Ned1 [Schizosaccharomyces cryophilus OY26]EPY52591.1 lipin Ned1 [Schizosaccharomyces cryophilus OY26]